MKTRPCLIGTLALLALTAHATRAQPMGPISGVYEGVIGTTDPIPLIQYYEQWGYRVGAIGELSAAEANALYGVDSKMRGIRLHHGTADHGLIRLLVWDKPVSDGVGMRPMRAEGSRWTATMTADATLIGNHAEDAIVAKMPVRYVPPEWARIYDLGRGQPFISPAVGVREGMLIQPLTRQIFFERFGYSLPFYGRIDSTSHLKASQVTHFGMIVRANDKAALAFYDSVLGLLRVRDDLVSTYEESKASRIIFDLKPGERYFTTDFDEPRSSVTDLQAARSGRLKIIRFDQSAPMEDVRRISRAGHLGLSLYTIRVRDLEGYLNRVKGSTATEVTAIAKNEFGERSFSFTAPDGFMWTLVEAK
jgi:uncharacterized glyoxalase superfamily protein PhnB